MMKKKLSILLIVALIATMSITCFAKKKTSYKSRNSSSHKVYKKKNKKWKWVKESHKSNESHSTTNTVTKHGYSESFSIIYQKCKCGYERMGTAKFNSAKNKKIGQYSFSKWMSHSDLEKLKKKK